MTTHAIEVIRADPDSLHVTSHYGNVTRTARIHRRELEAAAHYFTRADARPISIIHDIGLDESEVLSLLADLGS